MSEWRGFIPESKSWMSYDSMTVRQKIGFWRQFPRAYFKFRFAFPLLDTVKAWYMRQLMDRDA